MTGRTSAGVWHSLSKETEQVNEHVKRVVVLDEDAKVAQRIPHIIVHCVEPVCGHAIVS